MSSIRLTAGYPSGEEGGVGSNPIWITKIFAEVTQLARASAFQAESCGFESRLPLKLKNPTAIN